MFCVGSCQRLSICLVFLLLAIFLCRFLPLVTPKIIKKEAFEGFFNFVTNAQLTARASCAASSLAYLFRILFHVRKKKKATSSLFFFIVLEFVQFGSVLPALYIGVLLALMDELLMLHLAWDLSCLEAHDKLPIFGQARRKRKSKSSGRCCPVLFEVFKRLRAKGCVTTSTNTVFLLVRMVTRADNSVVLSFCSFSFYCYYYHCK